MIYPGCRDHSCGFSCCIKIKIILLLQDAYKTIFEKTIIFLYLPALYESTKIDSTAFPFSLLQTSVRDFADNPSV